MRRGGKQLLGDIMMVGAGAAWGATTLVIKGTNLRTAPPEKVFAYQIAVSIPMLALGMLLAGERMTAMPSAWSLGWLAYQTFWVVSLTLRGVVRHGAALFGEPSFGLHIPDPIVRGRFGAFRARGTHFLGLWGGGGAGDRRFGAGEPPELTVPAPPKGRKGLLN